MTQIIIHRVNTIKRLETIPEKYGVEIDVRGLGDELFLDHDPLRTGVAYDRLEDYLRAFNHAFIIFNLKEAGYEDRVIRLAEEYRIPDYFLLDVEFPYLYRATRKNGFRKIAVRYSEAEPIEMVRAQMAGGRPLLDWVWIDTNTRLPLDNAVIPTLHQFKTCLVCPERWGRPDDISVYIKAIKQLGFRLDAVMTAFDYAEMWGTLNRKNPYFCHPERSEAEPRDL